MDRRHRKTHGEYRGKPCPARARLAFFRVGESLDIELIQPDGQPSVWRDFLDKEGEGVHHIAFRIRDTQGKVDALGRMGMPLLQKGDYKGGRYSYIDAVKDLKVIVELLEDDE